MVFQPIKAIGAMKEFDFDRSRLSLTFDVERLQQEVTKAVQQFPPYIYYSVIPLTRAEGSNNTGGDYSNPDWTNWVETPLLKECVYIQEVLDSLECRKTNIRLMRLESGGIVKEHTDPQLDLGLQNQVRLHIPIFYNEHVDFQLNGVTVPLREGELWYLRLSDTHAVYNRGQEERVQLSIDVVVNDWVENLIVNGETALPVGA